MYHRAYPSVRSVPSSSNIAGMTTPSPRLAPLLPPAALNGLSSKAPGIILDAPVNGTAHDNGSQGPTICGMPLKYVSLVTLAVQNAALSIVMHYSRVSTPPHLSYSPAAAILLGEVMKGSISFVVAVWRAKDASDPQWSSRKTFGGVIHSFFPWSAPFRQVCSEIFSLDCWKLSIPAILYVVQNSLQFVAVGNLPVASFQVAYQMKILTTAAFSVALLRRRLTSTKWLSLFFLAIGVGIVQVQTTTTSSANREIRVGSAHDAAPLHIHIMSPLKGFGAVIAACFTSGLAGVYFEMVLKGSKADLWVRNVQLSLFSLLPALLPILYAPALPHSTGFISDLFRHFGGWAWATVTMQVFGGLVTAIVIKYSDNILKGFATSLSIILSFLASVALFDFHITPSFVIGASTVLAATAMYNQPPSQEPRIISGGSSTPFPGTPLGKDDPIIGHFPTPKKSSPFGSPRALASALGLAEKPGSPVENEYFSDMESTSRYLNAPYGSPFPSRTPTPRPEDRQ
ncbi:nucleotide-sugar transporter-domain-containing protein [Hygrophoropsis aurantiaca]|uniref:Nucleotide-sugar transporter-domain-containing protein n=1 Tax=Hygrophoropsis aurantiaca TaxID=72124 RepID=A0ACB8AM72_9AGAM|nr:nucleotide-sugar transporter-domain-containing protein [Hygrophoropsis aurantiaca]